MSFSFKDLTLKGVQASAVGQVLSPGRYVAITSDAKLKPTKEGGGTRLEVKYKEVNGKGSITGWINVNLPNSAKATEIGKEQLKALLVHGGHANPDDIGEAGVASINGLRVGILVGKDKTDATRTEVKGFMDPKTIPGYAGTADGPIGADDDIPF